jgi:redox-sensitive bicupin YhaK (pirin superfamily)
MGNTEILKRGDIQLTSAGTGISHSEKAHGEKQVHFLQIWSIPSAKRLEPKYFTRSVHLVSPFHSPIFISNVCFRHFTDEEKNNKFVQVVAPVNAPTVSPTREGTGPTPVHSPVTLSAALISPFTTIPHTFTTTKGYIHVIQTSGYNPGMSEGATVRVKGTNSEEVVLKEGDGVYVNAKGSPESNVEVKFTNDGDKVAEILVFDLD